MAERRPRQPIASPAGNQSERPPSRLELTAHGQAALLERQAELRRDALPDEARSSTPAEGRSRQRPRGPRNVPAGATRQPPMKTTREVQAVPVASSRRRTGVERACADWKACPGGRNVAQSGISAADGTRTCVAHGTRTCPGDPARGRGIAWHRQRFIPNPRQCAAHLPAAHLPRAGGPLAARAAGFVGIVPTAARAGGPRGGRLCAARSHRAGGVAPARGRRCCRPSESRSTPGSRT